MSERDELIKLIVGLAWQKPAPAPWQIADELLAAGWRKVPAGRVIVPCKPTPYMLTGGPTAFGEAECKIYMLMVERGLWEAGK